MEQKQFLFTNEIDKSEDEFFKSKRAKKILIKSLTEAQELYQDLKIQQECNNLWQMTLNNWLYLLIEYSEREKSIQELI